MAKPSQIYLAEGVSNMKKLLALLLLSVLVVLAQIGAQLNGTVIDPQGAVIPGATVDVLNVDTGQVLKTTTNDRGEWILAGMTAATYRVTVTASGFAKTTLENAGVPLTVNAKLEVGSTSERIKHLVIPGILGPERLHRSILLGGTTK
jgi:hypothetical protein